MGKGRKERIVPAAPPGLESVRLWIEDAQRRRDDE